MKLSNVIYPLSIPFSTGVAVAAMLALAPLLGWAVAEEEWIIVAGLGMVALAPVVIRWPVVSAFGAYAFLATSFDSIAFLQGSATLARPVGIVSGGVLLLAGLMERRLTRPPMAMLWFGLFMVWAGASAAWALDLDEYSFALRRTLNFFILYAVAVCFRPSRKELYSVCGLIVLGGVVAAASAYLFGFEGQPAGRARVVIGDQEGGPNGLGRSLLLPLALATVGFVGSHGVVQKAAAATSLGIIGVGVYISMSRGALVAMIATISVLLYRTRARREIIAAGLLLMTLTAVMPDRTFGRMTSVFTGEDATGSGRTSLWALGLDALFNEGFALMGAGLGNIQAVYNLFVLTNHSGFGLHNMYLTLWVELGVVGLALMLAVLSSQLLAAWRARALGHRGLVLGAAEAACFGVLASIMFGDYMWVKTFWLPWIVLTWAVNCESQPTGELGVGDSAAGSTRRTKEPYA